MSNSKKIIIALIFVAILVIVFMAGMFVGLNKDEKSNTNIGSTNENTSQTFYATIEKVFEHNGNNTIFAKGLEVNDINYQGEFDLSIKDDTRITWRGEKISLSDLNIGDNISVTFNDEIIAAIYPTPIMQISHIQLLDDEK